VETGSQVTAGTTTQSASLACGRRLLLEPVLGRDPGVDRASKRFEWLASHGAQPASAVEVGRDRSSRSPEKRGPFQFVPVMARATSDRLPKQRPFQANPPAVTVTSCRMPSCSRTSTHPGLSVPALDTPGTRSVPRLPLARSRAIWSRNRTVSRSRPPNARAEKPHTAGGIISK
jgi:hypothetical protein